MKKRDTLLLAGKIYMMKDFFEMHSENGVDVDSVDIEIVEDSGDEFEHINEDRVNKIVFEHKKVTLIDPSQYVFIPDLFVNYLEVKEKKNGKKTLFELELKDVKPSEIMEAFQVAFNRIQFEEQHSQKSPKEFEDKLVREMQ